MANLESLRTVAFMASRDSITGIWNSTYFERNGVDYLTSYVKLDGYEPYQETVRANSIWGDIENIRRSGKGHTKADLYSGKEFLGTITVHRAIDFFDNYGSYLDGDLKLNTGNGRVTLWDDDLANHWIGKIQYDNF